MKWDNLTMSQKQALMKIYVNDGVTNLDEIRNHYNRYAEGGDKDTWKPKYWFTPKYDGETLKDAITQAYKDGKKGDNIIYKGKAYKALLNNSDETQYNKEKQWEKNKNITKEQVVDTYIDKVMWTMENPNNTGYNPKNKKYYVYSDVALSKNIGPGIAYTSETGKDINYDKGYTKKELNALIRPELLKHMDEIENQLHSKYGESVDTMSLGNRLVLLDIAHNVRPKGSKKANMPVTGYPTLTKSMVTGNNKLAEKNTNSGSSRRQKMRNSILWRNDFEDFILKNQ